MATKTSSQATNNDSDHFTLIWIDASVDEDEENLNAQKHLRSIFNNVQPFKDVNDGEGYIKIHLEQTQFILIVSGRCGEELVPRIHQYPSLLGIYVFCMDQERNLQWAKNFPKVQSFCSVEFLNFVVYSGQSSDHRYE